LRVEIPLVKLAASKQDLQRANGRKASVPLVLGRNEK
jgi:hypothetical protein